MVKNNRGSEDATMDKSDSRNRHCFKNKKKMNKNMQRLGGRGLSLEAFANAKTINKDFNPSLIKKQREFYRNAKYVKKYKQAIKQQEQPNEPSKTSPNPPEKQNNRSLNTRPMEDRNETASADNSNRKRKSNRKNSAYSLNGVYEKKREEEEKARMEKEAMIRAKQEERQIAEARRKSLREKMFKKTKSGQPVMKYRIEHLLETIQSSS